MSGIKGRRGAIAGAVGLGVVIGILVITFAVHSHDNSKPKKPLDPNSPIAIANSFPVPAGAVVAFPDTVTASTATKGWRAQGATIEQACSQWREAYRGWIDQASLGAITGDDEPDRRCSLSGPKSNHRVDLSLTVYGNDPTPSVTLSVQKQ